MNGRSNETASTPADTTMMGVVHDALRRDLSRTNDVLEIGRIETRQRCALADHTRWMMEFLHAHHSAEDRGLWPLIRRADPDAAPVLERMDADHARIGPEIDRLEAAAALFHDDESPTAEGQFADALAGLEDTLLPHLRREEDEAMPLATRTLTQAQWDHWDQTENIAPKSKWELGIEGHWLGDSLDPQRVDLLHHQVGPVTRFVLLHVFDGPYRRACAARWGADVPVGPLQIPG
ncbi:hemerythrin domain-containing protein [Rhodococcus sp. TAF43]|uniref:hemerythrin domain-containing protein n=1 Tax=unclassified Rhodococcus (in: high G+C Gram-positive bacteria) TaxID=192944 RepID=UPI0015819490|nr:hemerythrin domain-containing protein [Rhodococcus sp. W8901]QKT09512.1 hemerythrin domain-containing protein [Rhodococcus sp. W8901]